MKKTWVRRLLLLIVIMIVWELLYMCKVFPELLFPSLIDILSSIYKAIMKENLFGKTINSLTLLIKGFGLGISLASLLSMIAMANAFCKEIVEDIVLIAHPIPGIAIFPICILWFGIGEGSIVFIVIHSVVWTLTLNMTLGFNSIPRIYKEIGKSMGLNRFYMIKDIYIPGAFIHILTGIKIGWSRAWRVVISAELVFGVMGVNSGLGWFILYKRNLLDISGMFAVIVVIVVIGIVVEDFLFVRLENATVKKWGLLR